MKRIVSVLSAILGWVAVVHAQPVQQVGTSSSFDVATWNIEWFGATGSGQGPSNEALQLENVASIMEGAGIDLWALQEISSVSAFSQLLTRLGPQWTGEIAPFTQTQRTAYVWRPDVVQKRISQLILTDFQAAFAGRPPFRFEATVTLPDTSFVVVLVNVHMKADGDPDSYDKRLEASTRLKNRLDLLERSANVILLGDLNDELGASITTGRQSPYTNFLQDQSNYRFLSKRLDDGNVCTYCGGTLSTLDHILVSNELFSLADRGTADRLSSVLDGDRFYIVNTSDHVPVFARLQGPLPTAVEPLPRETGLSVYPVPARDQLHIERSGSLVDAGPIELYDLLGRRVRSSAYGSLRVDWGLDGLAPGLYSLVIGGRPARLVPVL